MYLDRVIINNYHGLRHLDISFEEFSTVLIGENAWGKSSLLSALYKVLGGKEPCTFKKEDLYVPIKIAKVGEYLDFDSYAKEVLEQEEELEGSSLVTEDEKQVLKKGAEFYNSQDIASKSFDLQDIYKEDIKNIQITLIFKENSIEKIFPELRDLLSHVGYFDEDIWYITYEISGYFQDENFITEHNFKDKQGKIKEIENKEKYIKRLIFLNPVIRFRDSRMNKSDVERQCNSHDRENLTTLYKLSQSEDLNAKEVYTGIECLNQIAFKYLTNYEYQDRIATFKNQKKQNIYDMVTRPLSIETLDNLKNNICKKGFSRNRILLSLLSSAFLYSKGDKVVNKKSKPIVILEDIEARFHPSLLLSFWSLVENIYIQKIVTTNSGDLLSAVKLDSLRRLCRGRYDTRTFSLDSKMFSNDDLRRIAFHVRLNRPMSLYARTWILVEGETEIWLLSQIASMLNISLASEGIRLIEYAQCGLHPLLKLATAFGISFYVLTDGDEAGRKYSQTVKNFLSFKGTKKHLTTLNCLDIEHFLYLNGFEDVFLKSAGIHGPLKKGTTIDKVIDIAIKRKTKPGLALLMVEEMQKRGHEAIPRLFISMFARIRNLAREQAIFRE